MLKKQYSKICLTLFLIFIVVIAPSVNSMNKKMNEKILLRMTIYPIASTSECYVFTLYKKGKLRVSFGEMYMIPSEKILKKVKKGKTIVLKKSELNKTNNFLERLSGVKFFEDKVIIKDSWIISVKSKAISIKVYYCKLGEYHAAIQNLVVFLINLSPIKIDLHSWS